MRLIDADALIEFCAERWIPLNIDAVNMQPTIQPVATDTNVGDTISRQQAIDALDKRFDNVPMELTAEILKLRKDLRGLPTSQKKIVKCKDCRWWKKMKSSCQGRCKLLGIYPTGGWYCANGCVQKEKT